MKFYHELISTAEFAKLCRISKQALIYYHKIGLLEPYFVDEKGYRFYKLYQHEKYQIVKILKDLGIPLAEIKGYLENKNSENYLSLLEVQKKNVEVQIEHLKSIQTSLNREEAKVKKGREIKGKEYLPFIEEMEEGKIIVSEEIVEENSISTAKEINSLISRLNDAKINTFHINGMIKKEKLLKGEGYDITNLYVEAIKNIPKTAIRPKGEYVSIYHQGTLESTGRSYKKLMKFIKDNDLKIRGNSYEEILLDMRTQNDEVCLLKISIVISK